MNPTQQLVKDKAAFLVLVACSALTVVIAFAVQHVIQDDVLPGTVFASGVLASFLLFALILADARRREAEARRQALADQIKNSEDQLRRLTEQSQVFISNRGNLEAELAYERNLLRALLKNIPDRVYFKDAESKFLKCSHEVARRMNLSSPDEAVGKSDLDFFTEEHACCVREQEQRILQTGEPIVGVVEQEIWRNGDVTWALTTKMPLRDKSGKVIGTFGTSKDITALKRSEEALIKAGKLESIGLLAGGIAHEFNNVLTAIGGNLSIARLFPHDREKCISAIARAENAIERAKELSSRLLTFATGGEPIRKTIHLDDLLLPLEKLAANAGVRCQIKIPPSLASVDADESQLNLVFNGMISNAREAMSSGGEIEVAAETCDLQTDEMSPLPAGKYVKVSIRDNGVGIPPETLPKIFDPYFTTKKQSTGMGLAIAHSIIRKHDGDIRVESTPGKGTTFFVFLPASIRPQQEAAALALPMPGTGRILLMDDEEDLRTLAAMMLEMLGYEVSVAREGAECIEQYTRGRTEGKPFNVVILDLTIPNGMGGKETIQRLREIDPTVKAIVCSGYSYDPVMANHRDFGFSAVVPKPYNVEQLSGTLQRLLS